MTAGNMLGLKSKEPKNDGAGSASSTLDGMVNVPALAKTKQLKRAPFVPLPSVALCPSDFDKGIRCAAAPGERESVGPSNDDIGPARRSD